MAAVASGAGDALGRTRRVMPGTDGSAFPSANGGALGVATVHEAWMAPFDPENPARSATDSPERCEALIVAIAVSDGRVRQYFAPVLRGEGGVEFGPEVIDDTSPAFDLEPFRRVWLRRER